MIYQIKVDLTEHKGVSRTIEVSSDVKFHQLNRYLCDVFGRNDPHHLYRFYFPGKKTQSMYKIINSPLIIEHPDQSSEPIEDIHDMDINMMMSQLAPGLNVPPEIARGFLQMLEDQAPPQEFKKGNKTTIGDLCLKEGDQFHLEFDMITEWWHTLTVQKIDERSKEKKVMRLIKSKGEAPPQYDGAIGDTENGVAGLMAVVDWSGPRPKARWVMPPENIMNDYIDAEDLHNRRALQKPKAKNKKSG